MLENLPLQFERPFGLLLLMLLIPVVLLARRGWRGGERGKAWASLALRALVVILLTGAISQPTLVRRGEGLTVMVVADRSQSVPLPLRKESEAWLQAIGDVGTREKQDRVGSIVVGRTAEILARPDPNGIVPTLSHSGETDATDLASGVRQAISILPKDTASRILLVSDFNENVDSVMDEAEVAAANGIPIDVVVLEYEHPNEIVFEALRAPARSRVGQTSEVKLFIRSQGDATIRLALRQNDRPIDLDPAGPGNGMLVELKPGPNVVSVPVSFDDGGAQRFDASFEAVDPASDVIVENNVGAAVTFVGGGGRLLVIEGEGDSAEQLIAGLADSGLTIERQGPAALSQGSAYLNGFDALFLVGVGRFEIDAETDRAIRSSVHDMGLGLIMVGGPNSFGPGGWTDSETAKALPVRMDPPATKQMVRGALGLIVHSCEMPQGNYWSQQVALAAIDALSRLDLVGIIVYGGGLNGSGWHFPLTEAGDKSAARAAVRSMIVGDMQDFEGAVSTAYDGLVKSNAGQKHIIIISDGDPSPPSQALLQKIKAAKITITTVMVAGHGTQSDLDAMKRTADFTGGRFYNVTNPKQLPKIFTKEATIVTRSLIAEGDFKPQVLGGLPGPLKGLAAVPAIRGYVVTVPREGLSQVPVIVPAKEGNDPLYAWWNHGIGRAVAFTSDAGGRWTPGWVGWGDYRSFWEQTARWLMRPPTPPNVGLRTRIDGETAVVELEAVGEEGDRFLNFLRSDATVLAPDGSSERLELQQVGPGRYRGEFRAAQTGAYLVNVAVPTGEEVDGKAVMSSVQAAVSVPYAKEFRTVRDNAALGKRVADLTQGRELRMVDPRLAGVFDRTGLPVPRSARRIWELMAILAAALFLVDVAVRRLSIERGITRRLAERALGTTGKVGDATVDAWKSARQKAGQRPGGASGDRGTDGPGPGGAAERKARSDAARAAAKTVFEAPEGSASMDVAGEVKGDGAGGARPAGGTGGSAGADPTARAADDEAAPTSRLLRAKRRARGDGNDGSDGEARPDGEDRRG
jgi:hypothetical protein